MVNPHYQHGPLWCSHLISSMASWVMLPPHLERHLLYGESILSTWHSMVQPLNQQHGLLGDASTSSWASPSVWWIHIINMALYGGHLISSMASWVMLPPHLERHLLYGESTLSTWPSMVQPLNQQHGLLGDASTSSWASPSVWWIHIINMALYGVAT